MLTNSLKYILSIYLLVWGVSDNLYSQENLECKLSQEAKDLMNYLDDIQHESIYKFSLGIDSLSTINDPCVPIYIEYYRLKELNYTKKSKDVIGKIEAFKDRPEVLSNQKLRYQLDLMLLANYYNYSDFEKSAALLKSSTDYILSEKNEIDRLILLHGLSSQKTFIDGESVIENIEEVLLTLPKDAHWKKAKLKFAKANIYFILGEKEKAFEIYEENAMVCQRQNLIDEAITNLNSLAYKRYIFDPEKYKPQSIKEIEKAIMLALESGHSKPLNILYRVRGHFAWQRKSGLAPYFYYKKAYERDSINQSHWDQAIDLAYVGYSAWGEASKNKLHIADSIFQLGLSFCDEEDYLPRKLICERKLYIRKPNQKIKRSEEEQKLIKELKAKVSAIKLKLENDEKRLENLHQISVVNFKAKEQAIKIGEVEANLNEEILFRQKLVLGFTLLLLPLVLLFMYYYRRKYTYLKKIDDQNVIIVKQNEELKSVVKDLKDNNAALENFAHVAAHDIKAPLNTINSFIGLIKSKYSDSFDEKAKGYIDIISNSSINLQQFVNDLLSFSSLTIDLPEPEQIDVNEIVDIVQNNLFLNFENKQANFIQSKNMPHVLAHKSLVTQLFQNIISNSLKHGRKDVLNKIKLDWKKTDKHFIEFSIEDNGKGIPSENLDKVFELFNTFSTTEDSKGTGIGLATCKKIVDFYKGKIWIESVPNVGTTVYFTLPTLEIEQSLPNGNKKLRIK